MTTASRVLVDAHVHLHDCFDVPAFLDTAAANFAAAARTLGLDSTPPGCLMLTESRGVDRFASLAGGSVATGPWQVSPTDERVSVIARRHDGAAIALVAGRQIICREGLEVLALGTCANFADGEPIRDVLKRVGALQAMAVMPWGVGKWHGARGRLVAELIRQQPVQPLYVGDNGGRLGLAPEPRLFAVAQSAQIPVLPGSDPLPFAAQLTKVAGYGFMADAALDQTTPFATLRGYIDHHRASLKRFGRLESLAGFLRSQIAMQIQKRRGPPAS